MSEFASMAISASRRSLLGGSIAGLAALTLPFSALATPLPADLSFRVRRKGDDIGRHNITFEPSADGFRVRTHIELRVRVAFFTAFSFDQDAVDLWHDGALQSTDVNTNHNGETSVLRGRRDGDRFSLDGPKGAITVAAGMMTDLCFWNPAILAADKIVNVGYGQVDPIGAVSRGREWQRVAGDPVWTQAYSIKAGTRHGSVWYDENNRWVGATINDGEETLNYELLA